MVEKSEGEKNILIVSLKIIQDFSKQFRFTSFSVIFHLGGMGGVCGFSPKVRVSGLCLADAMFEVSLFDVFFSTVLRGFSPGTLVFSSIRKHQDMS